MSGCRGFAIVPAAGHSRRMGQAKLLLPWQGATVIEHVLTAWLASAVERIAIVVRPDDDPLRAVCESVARASGGERLDVVVPAHAPPEMKVSIQLGLQRVRRTQRPHGSDCWLLAPADMPRLDREVIDRLLQAHAARAAADSSAAILVPTFAGRRGHPVLFPWPLADAVDRLADDEGVNGLLRRKAVQEIPCGQSAILDDLDTPDDFRRLQSGGMTKPE